MKSNSPLLKTNAQRYTLAGVLFGLVFPISATVVSILSEDLPLTLTSMVTVQTSVPLLWIIDTAPVFLGFFAALAGRRQDKLEESNRMLLSREQELQAAQLNLEEQVKERTQELASMNQAMLERFEQLKSVVDVSHSLLAAQDMNNLLLLMAEIISRQFSFSHVGIYLLDEQKHHAVLVASNGSVDQQSIQLGRHIRLGSQSIIDFAIRSGQVQPINDIGGDSTFQPGLEFPDIRSRIVLPLKSGVSILGALDLQSEEARIFTQEYIDMLLILADVATTAIQNVFAQEDLQRNLREINVTDKSGAGQVWTSWAESIRAKGYRYDGIRAEPVKESTHSSNSNENVQSIPIHLRGQRVGSIKIKISGTANAWTDDDHAIAEAAAERAALALEGARLLDEAKRRASRETFLSDIAAKLGASFRLDSIMRDTVEELGHSLEGTTVSFQLVNPTGSAEKADGTSGSAINAE